MNKKEKVALIIIVIVIIVGAGVLYFVLSGGNNNQNQNQTVINTNQNTNTEDRNGNTNKTNVVTTEEITVTGMVFLKGYKTPSESFGVSTIEGHEIGLGKYDSMKEQFRPYIGKDIKVTFESVCRTTNQDCCRTLFPYCGTVKSWEPVEKENTE